MKWLWLPVALVLGLFAAYALRRNPLKQVQKELEAIEVGRKTKREVAEKGVEEARKKVETEYAEQLKQLDEESQERAQELRSDPARLAKFLIRVSQG